MLVDPKEVLQASFDEMLFTDALDAQFSNYRWTHSRLYARLWSTLQPQLSVVILALAQLTSASPHLILHLDTLYSLLNLIVTQSPTSLLNTPIRMNKASSKHIPPNYTLSQTPCPVLAYRSPTSTSYSSMSSTNLKTQPPTVQDSQISFPTPQILLVTLNRPKELNCINLLGHAQLASLWNWYDTEPSLRCAILTGTGRAFCAGADLKEWDSDNADKSKKKRPIHDGGFGGMSRRGGKKPIIAAVSGICFGGGCEMIINADMVIAAKDAVFGLPEVTIGVVALAGALTRLVRTVGRQRAVEMALTGRRVPAEEAREWGLVNKIVDGEVVKEAIAVAESIARNSPDAVIVSREGIKLGWEGIGAEEGTVRLLEGMYAKMEGGENMVEGVRSFVEKRKPRYVDSKL